MIKLTTSSLLCYILSPFMLLTCLTCVCIYASITSSSRAPKHIRTREGEAKLVECLVELVSPGGSRLDNGTFRSGYLSQLQRMMVEKLLRTNIQGSQIKSLKEPTERSQKCEGHPVMVSVERKNTSALSQNGNYSTFG